MSHRVRAKQIASIMGLTPKALENQRAKGEGPPYYKLGTSRRATILYDISEVESWMQARRVDPQAASSSK